MNQEEPSQISDVPNIEPEFYELIGRAASDWAWLEMMVNDCLWALSGTPYGAGACITAQIYTFDSRMKALIALLRLKDVDQKLINRVNTFHEVSRKATLIRNRIIHDMWGFKDGKLTNSPLPLKKPLYLISFREKLTILEVSLRPLPKPFLTSNPSAERSAPRLRHCHIHGR